MSHTIKVTEGGNHSIKQPAIKIADIKHVKKFDIVITEGLRVKEMFPNYLLHCYEQKMKTLWMKIFYHSIHKTKLYHPNQTPQDIG